MDAAACVEPCCCFRAAPASGRPPPLRLQCSAQQQQQYAAACAFAVKIVPTAQPPLRPAPRRAPPVCASQVNFRRERAKARLQHTQLRFDLRSGAACTSRHQSTLPLQLPPEHCALGHCKPCQPGPTSSLATSALCSASAATALCSASAATAFLLPHAAIADGSLSFIACGECIPPHHPVFRTQLLPPLTRQPSFSLPQMLPALVRASST